MHNYKKLINKTNIIHTLIILLIMEFLSNLYYSIIGREKALYIFEYTNDDIMIHIYLEYRNIYLLYSYVKSQLCGTKINNSFKDIVNRLRINNIDPLIRTHYFDKEFCQTMQSVCRNDVTLLNDFLHEYKELLDECVNKKN